MKSEFCDESTEIGDQEVIQKEFIDCYPNITLIMENKSRLVNLMI